MRDRSLLLEVKELLRRYEIIPSKRLGQHFLIDEGILDREVKYAGVSAEDTVLEIGAGLGFLTRKLAERARHVYAVEIDRRLCQVLNDILSKYDNITIINADILKIEFPPDVNKVVANIPYSISSGITFKLLNSKISLSVLTYQWEFARRMTARPGTKCYGRLSVMVSIMADVEILERIPRIYFFPPPDVDSAIVRILRRNKYSNIRNFKIFENLVRRLFSFKGKTLRKALIMILRKSAGKEEALTFINKLEKEGYPIKKRIFELTPSELINLANMIYNEGYDV